MTAVWTVQVWCKDTKRWRRVATTEVDGARDAVKLIALKGKLCRATHPSGQEMRCYPALGYRPLTFYHYRPLEK